MPRLLAPFVIVLLLALGASLWLDRPEPRADFVVADVDEIFTLDPQRMSWMQDFRIAASLYEPLVRWRNDDFTVVPGACDTMPEVSADGLTYTFRIRDDAKWSDGSPLTAHDFAWSWMRAILPDTAADYTQMFFVIRGAREFFDWRAARLREFTQLLSPSGRGAGGEGSSAVAETDALSLWTQTEQRFRGTVGVEAVDARTLRVTLARPTPYFLDLVAFAPFLPVYRPCVEGWTLDEAKRDAIRTNPGGWVSVEPPPFEDREFVSLNHVTGRLEQRHEWTKPGRLVSNGPYLLADWRYKRGLRLERNPHYHSPSMVESDSVSLVSISDANTAVLAFEQGQLDWLSDVSTDYQPDLIAQRERYVDHHRAEYDRLLASGLSVNETLALLPPPEADERRNVHVTPTFGTDFYSFNCREKLADGRDNPFHHPGVRRAFVMTVDRNAIVSQVTRLNEPIATALTPPGSIPGYDVPEGVGFDPRKGREELASAGWTDRDGDGQIENERGEPFPIVDLLYSTNTSRYKAISLALRDMWERELGVKVELRGKENKTFKEDLKSGQFMIGRGRWYGDYGDPTTFLDICRTGDGNNDRGYSNPLGVDDLLDAAANEADPVKRFAILVECERYLFQEDPPMIVLCTLVQLSMYEPGKVTGLTRHPRLLQYLWQVEVSDTAE